MSLFQDYTTSMPSTETTNKIHNFSEVTESYIVSMETKTLFCHSTQSTTYYIYLKENNSLTTVYNVNVYGQVIKKYFHV